MDIETREITLGETAYTVKPLPFKRSKVWRRRLADEVKPLFDQVAGLETAEFAKPADLLALWPVAQTILIDGIDAVFELLLAFDPQLEKERKRIEETATDKQILAAFWEVVAITDPFGLSRVIARQSGRTSTQETTLSNSPSLSGGSPLSEPSASTINSPLG